MIRRSNILRFANRRANRQRGATLIMGLLILLILTIIGGTAMNSSRLELKMSANVLQKSVSFQESEDTRELAERAVATVVTTMKSGGAFPTSNGYYNIAGGAAKPNVTDSNFWSVANASKYVNVNASNKYVIEYLGIKSLVLDDRSSNASMYLFRLSVLGQGSDGASQTLAQTMYMKN